MAESKRGQVRVEDDPKNHTEGVVVNPPTKG